MRSVHRVIALLIVAACSRGGGRPVDPELPPPAPDAAVPAPAPRTVVISIVGTNDLHGQLRALPVLASYVDNLRRARARDGGVLLVDAGDMFQGSLESNLDEGATVVAAYRAIGYHAATLGNHEFDYGPPGPPVVARSPEDDPRGAIKLRVREAGAGAPRNPGFAMLAANIAEGEARPDWVQPSTLVEIAGVKIGIVGVTTMQTPTTTMPANFKGLTMMPIAEVIAEQAAALRAQGARVVVVAAHAGSECSDFSDPADASSCKQDGEIFEVARALPAGAVDVIVAGHSHAGIAHQVAGIAVIESYARGLAFGRIDLTIGATVSARIHPPQRLCPGDPAAPCAPGDYEGAPVAAVPGIAKLIEPAYLRARAKRDEALGVTVDAVLPRAHKDESALGNLITDLMRKARPADVAITNGGSLRTDLPAGALTYGALFEAQPFDNRFATTTLSGAQLRALVAANLATSTGLMSFSGVDVAARCKAGALVVELKRKGKPVRDTERLTVVTSDFLASGGDGLFPSIGITEAAFTVEDGDPIRDVLAAQLQKQGGVIAARTLFDPKRPRFAFPGPKPVVCN